ncbi:MAG: hypothetical protein ABSA10_07415 [Anaerolineales bacterium]|jgi:hypothetical protein
MLQTILRRILYAISVLPTLLALLLVLAGDSYLPPSTSDKVHMYTAPYEFDFISWEADAIWAKGLQFLLGDERYLSEADRHDTVLNYNRLLDSIFADESNLAKIFSDPAVSNPMQASTSLRETLAQKRRRQAGVQSLVESILQSQVSTELNAQGFSIGGEALPPVLFRYSQIPLGLVISPRNVIRQDANIQLIPGLTLEQQIELESEVEKNLNVSALVVPLGGLGTYPTMIMESSWLNWIVEAVSHEWTHIYLYFTPLGQQYETGGDMRTINETTASLVGKQIGAMVIEHNYPELVPPPPPPAAPESSSQTASQPPAFDYSHEMYVTRVEADRLLAAGQIDEAEKYMEARRVFIMEHVAEHGNYIRRLNQAFFAFYGTYADTPGERGEDPVGPAVVKLYNQCPTVGAFLRAISKVTTFRQLQGLTAAGGQCG